MSVFKIFTAATVAGLMLFSMEAWANSGCHDVQVEANVTAVDPMLIFGNYAGSALISIDGQTPMPAAVSYVLLEVKLGDDGSIHPEIITTFDFGPMGVLSVKDHTVLSPTDTPYIYTMNSRLDNLVGTGMFTGVMGKFTGHGQFSVATATVSAHADGRICW